MAKRIIGSTPKRDGYRMPAEFEPQSGVWMLWPERNDNWRDGAKPAQRAFLDVADSDIAHRLLHQGAKAMAASALDLYLRPELVAELKKTKYPL